MLRFECDYGEGAHPRVMELLVKSNLEQTPGYGEDHYCDTARILIREACQAPEADVHFLVGGTQANFVVIEAALRPWQGVLCAENGHINTHETGAVEATGHKVLALPAKEGKITAAQIREACKAHYADASHEHITQPGMVYLSAPTEFGTLYTKAELEEISLACRELALFLFVDGARMGYGLMSEINDLSLADYARLCDAFTIGGTKVGALFGEAVVLTSPLLKKDFRYLMKQRGAMLAKGRLLGVQFTALFEGGLYFDMAKHADTLAMRLRRTFLNKGWPLLYDSFTNQQFPVIPDEALEQLGKEFSFSFWQKMDGKRSAVRFCTSWATTEEAVDRLIASVKTL
ncbi:low specificity L-threonine aldolase [Mailhella massiliensis]|uniref:Low specificity L-threonine aldolase n=1 Tax=Mailhella massiliensis TaxID=1903261 RepID=A0A921DS04_9BACT|nr:beta-eliminating lyase-related protein [Mailhella massiliensis]HJD97671.1 low specificity L-threonine aldolase [Mailhella massiliensis]